MAILLIEVPFKVAGGWLEYTSSVCLWWAVGKERPQMSKTCIEHNICMSHPSAQDSWYLMKHAHTPVSSEQQ